MKTRTTEQFIELIPDEGKFIANKDLTEVYEYSVYLSNLDSINNYVEIDEATADEIRSRAEQ